MRMDFFQRILGMITNPDATTDDIAKEPRIEEGLILVGLYMILMMISAYIAFSHVQITGSYQGLDAASMSTILLVGVVLGAIFYSLIGWPITAGAIRGLSMALGGSGKFYPKLLTLIGYCMIPLILVSLISIILALFMPTTVIDLTSLSSGLQSVSVSSTTANSALSIVSIIVSLAGAIWTAFMMFFAVKNGEKLDVNKSVAIVAILFILNLLFTYRSLI
jgi:hypothetical protein